MHPEAQCPGAAEAPSDARGAGDSAWVAALVLALLAALCCAPLLGEGWFMSHEVLRPLARSLAAAWEITAGDPYPRWLSSGYVGKGIPLFEYYPPAFSLLVAYLYAAGVPLLAAAKLVVYLLFLAGALGAYLWVRRHLGHWPALVAAVLYLFAPYHFVDLYVRGAMAEFTSLAALPFLFAAVDAVAERGSAGRLAGLALSSAAVVLSHFLGAFMVAPFAVGYALARVAGGGGVRALGRIAVGAGLGAMLSAFYWLPALAGQGALGPERGAALVSGYYSVFLHFVEPRQWIDPRWGFGGSVLGPRDQMSFQLGLVVVGAVAASLLLLWAVERPARRFVLLSLALGAVALALTSGVAAPLYRAVEPLQLVQFPWRFLGPATLFLAAAGGGAVRAGADRRAWLGPALAALAVTLAVIASTSQRAVEQPLPVTNEAELLEALAGDIWSARFGNSDEYLPRDADPAAASTRPGGPIPGGERIQIGAILAAGRKEVTFEVSAGPGGGMAVVPWHAFPGWEVTLDGRGWPLAPGPGGLVAFQVPEGSHVAHVRFGTTPPRVAGWLLAAAALGLLGAAGLRGIGLGARRSS